MEIASIVVAAILFIFVLIMCLSPIMQASSRPDIVQENIQRQVTDFRIRMYRTIDSIHDLDFDFDTGKITADVYAQQRKMLIGKGVSLFMQLEEAQSQVHDVNSVIESMITAKREGQNVDSLIEAAIAKKRGS
jgi:hypothetical protein